MNLPTISPKVKWGAVCVGFFGLGIYHIGYFGLALVCLGLYGLIMMIVNGPNY